MGHVVARKKSKWGKCTRGQESTAQQYNRSALAGAKFKTELLAYNNTYCSWPTTMPIVPVRLTAFHLGQTSYGGSKVPCRFLSLDTLWRSHFRPYRGTSWPGWLGHFAFRRLGVCGQEPQHRVMVWHLTVRIYKFVRIYEIVPKFLASISLSSSWELGWSYSSCNLMKLHEWSFRVMSEVSDPCLGWSPAAMRSDTELNDDDDDITVLWHINTKRIIPCQNRW